MVPEIAVDPQTYLASPNICSWTRRSTVIHLATDERARHQAEWEVYTNSDLNSEPVIEMGYDERPLDQHRASTDNTLPALPYFRKSQRFVEDLPPSPLLRLAYWPGALNASFITAARWPARVGSRQHLLREGRLATTRSSAVCADPGELNMDPPHAEAPRYSPEAGSASPTGHCTICSFGRCRSPECEPPRVLRQLSGLDVLVTR